MLLHFLSTATDFSSLNNINFNSLNLSNNLSVEKNKTYIIFEFSGLFGIDSEWLTNSSILLPYGIELYVKKENIYNSGNLLEDVSRQTNTIIVRVEDMN